uniref:ORF7 protein n=1 Tax=Bat Coronavirus RfZJ20 TaxID=3018891 RepID=A0AA49EC88_9NIDO|nr:ORF7 protein [Bat Coronavirus RfZJ20]WCC61919.1 ORF7 protein [Bat Coronavirus RfZJ20]
MDIFYVSAAMFTVLCYCEVVWFVLQTLLLGAELSSCVLFSFFIVICFVALLITELPLQLLDIIDYYTSRLVHTPVMRTLAVS